MPIVQPFDPASVVEVPPPSIPEYDEAGYYNPDRDSYVTYEQACRIVQAMYHPELSIVAADIPKATQLFKVEDEAGEYRYICDWSNGFHQTLPAIGRQLDIEEKNKPGEGIKRTLKKIYDEMRVVGLKVDWWVYDRVK